MNILVIGKFYTEGFGLHIAETLEAMGHAVQRFEPGYRYGRIPGPFGHRIDQAGAMVHSVTDCLPAVRAWRLQALWDLVASHPPDVVIVTHDFLWPGEVTELKRRTGAAVALWFPDAIVNIHRGFFMNAPYDALFFKDPFIVSRLRGVLASPVYYLPECFNPERHRLDTVSEGELEPYRCDITSAGAQHSWRVAMFKHLQSYDVKVWGPPAPLWMETGSIRQMFQGRPVFNRDKALAFRAAKIVLNTLHYGEIWGVNARTFETAGIGAFQLVNWSPGIGQLFREDQELVCFRDIADLKQKIDYWLPRENERGVIAIAGKTRAQAEHTYNVRLVMLLDTIAGKMRGFPLPVVTDSL